MKFIVTNFAYGTGPYLRTTDLAIAFNNELENKGHSRMPIVVPWVYGARQKKVMLEEFEGHEKKYPGEILLDAHLGAILRGIFYGDEKYETALARWVSTRESAESEVRKYMSGTLALETLHGEQKSLNGKGVAVELNRSPRLFFGVSKAYSTTFGYTSEILANTLNEPEGSFKVDKTLFEQGRKIADEIESAQTMRAISTHGTFSWKKSYTPRHHGEFYPPIGAEMPKKNLEKIEPGIYVTVTGIPGLERLYGEAKKIGMKLYSNDTDAVPGSTHALPDILTNPSIKLHVARSGWSSVWLSMFLGVPFVAPAFDPEDDPEIYFNNKAVEGLGIGVIYRNESLEELLQKSEKIKKTQEGISREIKEKWGEINGTTLCAKRFAEDFVTSKGI